MSDVVKIAATKSTTETGLSVTGQMLWIGALAVTTAIGARIEIPHQPVPYTMQTLSVLLAGAFLGPRNGALSQILYLAAGAAGAPVFALGSFGIEKLFGPTGGYLLAFPVAAFLVGFLVPRHRTLLWTMIAMAAGLVVIFASGTLYLNAFYLHNISSAFTGGFLLFTWWDMLKLCAAAMTYHEVAKRWPRAGERKES